MFILRCTSILVPQNHYWMTARKKLFRLKELKSLQGENEDEYFLQHLH